MSSVAPQILTRSVRDFLKAPRVARLATIGADGYPHIVPIWFIRDRQDILFGCNRTDRKVRNLLASPKGAVAIGGDVKSDKACYMIRGDLSIEDDNTQVVLRKILTRSVDHEGRVENKRWLRQDTLEALTSGGRT